MEGLRALSLARRSAVKARTAAINQMKAILVMAPDPVRARFAGLGGDALAEALLRCRGSFADPVAADTVVALKILAERCRGLDRRIETLTVRIDPLVTTANPGLRAAFGVGPAVAAQLLLGVTPTVRGQVLDGKLLTGRSPRRSSMLSSSPNSDHRRAQPGPAEQRTLLRRAVRRRAGARLVGQIPAHAAVSGRGPASQPRPAPHRAGRMSHHAPTRAFVARQTEKGRSSKAILRLLKRAIAREIYRYLTRHVEVPDYADLRPTRQAKNITLTAVANHFELWPPSSPASNEDSDTMTSSPSTTRTWLAARMSPRFRHPGQLPRRPAGAVKMQRPTGRTILTAPSTDASEPAEPPLQK